jgi:hypothetical protein
MRWPRCEQGRDFCKSSLGGRHCGGTLQLLRGTDQARKEEFVISETIRGISAPVPRWRRRV